ncbi:MAG TPA: multicopper oxidase domain-containing protein [Polyangiaceae bacterium]|nr:multicopper oxidase domain-containing protein [Polyangiaceae bacterium]
MKRREFMETTLGVAAGALVGCDACTSAASTPPQVEVAASSSLSAAPASPVDLEVVLTAAPDRIPLLPGQPTDVLRFSASIAKGARDALVQPASGYLGPTLRVKRGQRVRVRFNNNVGEDSIVHWHGLYVSEANDGHPRHSVASGKQYLYDFQVDNPAGTYWYHPHPDHRTGVQVYAGLAGLLVITDDDERRIGLPDGDQDISLVLQDRSFDANNQLSYSPNPMTGFLGDRMLVNGQLPQTREVRSGPHRLRILNGSNSRIYKLGWSNGSPLVVIGTDGGLLAAPQQRTEIALAPAQRIELWANFGADLGNDVWLESHAFDDPSPAMGMGMGMMGRGGAGAPGVPQGAPLRIQRFVASGDGRQSRVPDRLVSHSIPSAAEVSNTKTFATRMQMMGWLLNDRSFEMQGVAANEHVRLGTVEEWEFVNPNGMMPMPHPIHVHGRQFRIIDRQPGPGFASLRQALFDEGWLDTFLLLPGDKVRIRVRFDRYAGMFLYHCHNLEHEDLGMMRNYLVEAG